MFAGAAAGALFALAAAAGTSDPGGIVPEWARPPGADAPGPGVAPRSAPPPTVPPRPAVPTLRAAPVAAPAPATNQAPIRAMVRHVDAWQDTLERGMVWSVRRFDRFFGDEEIDDDNEATRVRFALGLRVDADEGPTFEQRLRVRLALPQLENRLQIIADNMIDAEDPLEGGAIGDAAEESKPDAGLRYVFKADERRRLSADAGLRLGGSPQVFGKLRGRVTVPYDPWEMRLVETLQWYSHDGFGETSEMRWSRILRSRGWLFQSSTRVGWREDESGVTPAQSFSWQNAVRGEWGHRYTIKAEWPETPSTSEAAYAIEYGYRRLIHSDWLFLEISPGVDFSQERRYEPNPYVTCLLDVSFDQAGE